MARFDVFPNPGQQARTTPYLLDVQSDLLDGLESCVVVPMRRVRDFPDVGIPTRLTPVLTMDGEDYLMETPKLAAVPRRILKKRLQSLAVHQDQITAALDFLFKGY